MSATAKIAATLVGLSVLILLPAIAGAQGTLFVEGDNVGIGTATPAAPLHVATGKGEVRVTSTGAATSDHASLLLESVGGSVTTGYDIRANATTGALEFREPANSGTALKFRSGAANNSVVVGPEQGGFARVGIGTANPQGAAGAHSLDVNGAIYQRGSQLHADYVFEPGYRVESIEEHSAFMWENRHLPAVPARRVDADGLEIVELGSHRRGILEELEKAHIYIEQLNQAIEELRASNRELVERVEQLDAPR